jgi:hypothetical protein
VGIRLQLRADVVDATLEICSNPVHLIDERDSGNVVLGCLPLWTATGAGSVSRQIMGTTVIGGMLAATLIAVFIIPVLFVTVEKLSQRKPGMTVAPSPLSSPQGDD